MAHHNQGRIAVRPEGSMPLERIQYEMSPSGGRAGMWCVHPMGSAENVIKHVPYQVAEALVTHLNGDSIQSIHSSAMAAFILETLGTAR
jgi:hypothetical protein